MAAEVASRGETRTLLLALKIIEAQQLELKLDHSPLLLLDDVFGELDGARRRSLTQFLQKYQTFITTTEADVVVQHFSKTAQIILTG
jgi:DNA replication and repair protein RecF